MAILNARPRKLYSVKDIIRISGLNRNQIYYLSKTSGAIPAAQAVPGRQLFDLRGAIWFRFAAELLRQGINPERVGGIISSIGVREVEADGQTYDFHDEPWRSFLKDRQKYERKGFFLVSREVENNKYVEYLVGASDEVEGIVEREMSTFRYLLSGWSSLVIDLLKIIHDVEEKTGETLE